MIKYVLLAAAAIAASPSDAAVTTITFTQVNHAGSVTAVPEPASWAMMLGGFGLLGAATRRQRKVIAA